jgi:hypothetical protein
MEEPAQSVRIPPGSRTVTLIPNGPTSFARTSEKPPTAHLAAWYADPALAQACVDLAPRLRRTAEILLAGLIPSRSLA